MSADKNSTATRTDVLLEQTLAMLAPLVRLLVAHGVTYPQLVAALKPAFLRAAHAELSAAGKRISDSAISIVSGVHRKDVRALTSDGRVPDRVPPRVQSLVSEVMLRWSRDPRYAGPDGVASALPLRNGNGSHADDDPSFEQLAQSVSRDFHSRAMLDEMLRLGIVEIADDRAHLRPERLIADRAFIEMVASVSRNVKDHLAAIEGNVGTLQAGDRAPFLEQSVCADALGPESINALHELARRILDSAVRRMDALAQEGVKHDQQPGGQAMQMRFGMYFYAERELPLTPAGQLPMPGQIEDNQR